MSGGWIKLHRELLDKSIWQESTAEQKAILITLLSMANYEPNKWEFQGEQYELQAGQLITSLPSIAEKSGKGISIQNVRTALKRFEKLGFLTDKSTNKNRLITIANWGFYQGCEDEPTGNLTGNQQATNSYKEIKNKRSINSPAKAEPAAAPSEAQKATKAEQIPYKQIIEYLNEKAQKKFKHTAGANQKLIKARWNEGYTFDDFKHVIDTKAEQWLNSDAMNQYLRPATLFSNKFDSYLNEQPKQPQATYEPHIVTENDLPAWLLE